MAETDKDAWSDNWLNEVHSFATALEKAHKTNPWSNEALLPQALNALMTELWDKGFSQTEIRQAFNEAVSNMSQYAAGQERRS